MTYTRPQHHAHPFTLTGTQWDAYDRLMAAYTEVHS